MLAVQQWACCGATDRLSLRGLCLSSGEAWLGQPNIPAVNRLQACCSMARVLFGDLTRVPGSPVHQNSGVWCCQHGLAASGSWGVLRHGSAAGGAQEEAAGRSLKCLRLLPSILKPSSITHRKTRRDVPRHCLGEEAEHTPDSDKDKKNKSL